ncbi:RDD family protein [Luteolibacter ambystomatis]|uniref:RDD family protein n=1 Tax=Luteolibacter ambystomatis TaxID=2824561 RepID=A0A975J092_9BACT|nr:RDD family protein [Luteolibacter ambystomatis]QUE51629.1 RDD family protein [Luteolibacter ambystomatis]
MDAAAEKLDTLQSVELAEGVEIRLRIAGPGLRAAAYGLDLLIQLACAIVVGICLSLAGIAVGGEVVTGLWLLMWFLLSWWYPVIFEAGKRGATPGKRAMGLRVVQTSGAPITVGQAIIRNFLRFADGMPAPLPMIPQFVTYGFGLASCLATKRFQRLGDLAAGTVVVYDRIPVEPIISAPPPMSSVRPPVLLSADEVRALTVFRERAGLWSEARRVEIADHAAGLSGSKGPVGVARLMSMAHWLQEKRER